MPRYNPVVPNHKTITPAPLKKTQTLWTDIYSPALLGYNEPRHFVQAFIPWHCGEREIVV